MYDVIVIGGGAAGLTVALGAAEFNKKTLLIERDRIGGECTHVGCMPSKTLIHLTSQIYQQKHSLIASDSDIPKWSILQRELANTVQSIYFHEKTLLAQAGVEILKGDARFIDSRTLQVTNTTYTAKKIYICTGSSSRKIDIAGSEFVDVHTNESIFSLSSLPASLAILGGGAIGCELGQAFSRLGVDVHIISNSTLLPYEDEKASQVITSQFESEGISLHLNTTISHITKNKEIVLENAESFPADALLLSIGRVPSTHNLGLENTKVQLDDSNHIITNSYLRAARGIYALGDCTSHQKFSHVCEEHGRVALANLAGPIPIKRYSSDAIPHVTFTDPEVAQIGMQASDIRGGFETFTLSFKENDRAKTQHDTRGFVELHARRVSGKILGATIVGRQAGELLSLVSLAMHNNVSVRALSATIQAYPTRAQLVRHTADFYYRDFLAGVLRKLGL